MNKKKAKNNISIDDVSEQLSNSLNEEDYFTGDTIQKKLQQALLNCLLNRFKFNQVISNEKVKRLYIAERDFREELI